MLTDAFIAANRRNWDERVAIHRRDATGFYAIDDFFSGNKKLHAIESGELGQVEDKRLVHLQCHFGLDTLILARHGAEVTGLDFSPAAIDEARKLSAETAIAAEFVCADVYDARAALSGHFEIVFTSWGTICWLPDIKRWAEVIASLLVLDGVFYFADAHPAMLVLEERDGRLVREFADDTPADEPLIFDNPHSYSGDTTPLSATRTYEWIHSLPQIHQALAAAGLVIEFVHEHPWLPWPPFPMCERSTEGYRLPASAPQLPLALSLRARKAAR